MKTVPRVAIVTDTMKPTTWQLALTCAKEISGAQGKSDIVLLTHTKHQLQGTSLAVHLGPAICKSLEKGGTVAVPGGGKLRHATMRTVGRSAKDEVVIAFYANGELLDCVDGLVGAVGVVAVPEMPDEADKWIDRWGAVVYGRPEREPKELIDDPVCVNALTALSRSINLGNAVLNPRDEEHVKETLRILRNKGHRLDAESFRSWAIRNGWQMGAADRLGQLALRIDGLATKPSLGSIHNPEGKYASWKA